MCRPIRKGFRKARKSAELAAVRYSGHGEKNWTGGVLPKKKRKLFQGKWTAVARFFQGERRKSRITSGQVEIKEGSGPDTLCHDGAKVLAKKGHHRHLSERHKEAQRYLGLL